MKKPIPKTVAIAFLSVMAVFTALSLKSGMGQQLAKKGEARPPSPEQDALQMIKELCRKAASVCTFGM